MKTLHQNKHHHPIVLYGRRQVHVVRQRLDDVGSEVGSAAVDSEGHRPKGSPMKSPWMISSQTTSKKNCFALISWCVLARAPKRLTQRPRTAQTSLGADPSASDSVGHPIGIPCSGLQRDGPPPISPLRNAGTRDQLFHLPRREFLVGMPPFSAPRWHVWLVQWKEHQL